MKASKVGILGLAVLGFAGVPAWATVQISYLKPSQAAPQKIGATIVWTAAATDSNSGTLTFQFNLEVPGATSFTMVKDFNTGTQHTAAWTAQPFVWTPTGVEGFYQIQVVAKDFVSGESASKTVRFHVTPLVSGSTPVVASTANPLVALFSAPACAAGSVMRVSFHAVSGQPKSGSTAATTTSWMRCHASASMTFEIAGMYPSATYEMFSQTKTGTKVVNGPTMNFTTGALPPKVPFPSFTPVIPPGAQTDTADGILLDGEVQLGHAPRHPYVATDLNANILWYYYPPNETSSTFLTRPLLNGGFLGIENGQAWYPSTQAQQLLRRFDLAGNVVQETNTGIIAQQLTAMGVADGSLCTAVPSPAPLGAACIGAFHHEATESLPNGYTAALLDIEKIFPAGMQGDNTGLPVDIMGDMIVVLDTNWQVVWYFDTFQHASGAPQLDINRPAVLGETCGVGQVGCPPMLLLGDGIAPLAKDWLHANSIYYWPQTGDLIWSARHQDWVMRISYQNATGNGDILWRMGPEGDFTFNNINNDLWPWFSHQHEVGIENNGAGVMTLFDNGNTRVSAPPLGLGSNCGPSDCDSRGMALNFDESTMQVTPALSADLGVFSTAMGSAQLLSDGTYFFVAALVVLGPSNVASYDIEFSPSFNQVFNMQGLEVYRGWQIPSLYDPPIT
jgi:arylsulfate sulfotransferase